MSEMTDDELPFVCNERGCGMRFTNEDHLSVHMRKHDLCLALSLTPGGLSPGIGLFTDQTPTPTKFLRNCEEIGLFQDLVQKNPFEDSFKKAMGEHGDHSNVVRSLSNTETGDLDTPQPPVPKIMIGDSEIEDNSGNSGRPPKPPDITISSIVPKKRKKFLRKTSSQPVSTTSDEEESVVGSTSISELTGKATNQTETSQVLETESDLESIPVSTESVDELTREIFIATSISSTSDITQTDLNAQPVPSKIRKQEVKFSSAVSNSIMVTTVSSAGKPQPAIQPVQPVQSTPMIVVLMQLPNGQTIPVQIPVSNIASTQPLQHLTAQTPTTPMIFQQSNLVNTAAMLATTASNPSIQIVTNGNSAAKLPPLQNMSTSHGGGVLLTLPTTPTVAKSQLGFNLQQGRPGAQMFPGLGSQQQIVVLPNSSVVSSMQNTGSVSSVSSTLSSETKFSGSQSYTKERLKAAIKQQTTPTHIARAGYNLPSALMMKMEPNTSVDTVSSSSNMTSPEDYSGREVDGGDSNDDSESKRSKFLERNRAAAARCRQKRKKWVETLEKKASDLSTVNNKLNSEINKLRSEVAGLKTLLLAHKDCPVTHQQRIQGQLAACDELQIIENTADQSTALNMSDLATSVDDDSATIVTIHPFLPQRIAPMLLKGNQSTGQTIVSLQQTGNQSTSLGMVHPLVHAGMSADGHVTTSAGGINHLGVITGPNTLSLLPKILNLDGNLHIVTSSRS